MNKYQQPERFATAVRPMDKPVASTPRPQAQNIEPESRSVNLPSSGQSSDEERTTAVMAITDISAASAEISIHLRAEPGRAASAFLKIVEREVDGTSIRSRKSLKISDVAAAISLFASPGQLGSSAKALITEAKPSL